MRRLDIKLPEYVISHHVKTREAHTSLRSYLIKLSVVLRHVRALDTEIESQYIKCLVNQVITASWEPKSPRDNGFKCECPGWELDLDRHIGITSFIVCRLAEQQAMI